MEFVASEKREPFSGLHGRLVVEEGSDYESENIGTDGFAVVETTNHYDEHGNVLRTEIAWYGPKSLPFLISRSLVQGIVDENGMGAAVDVIEKELSNILPFAVKVESYLASSASFVCRRNEHGYSD